MKTKSEIKELSVNHENKLYLNRQFRNISMRGRGGMGAGQNRGQGRGLGGGNNPGAGPSGFCICPKCGYKVTHQVGQRCMDLVCPTCGVKMIRG